MDNTTRTKKRTTQEKKESKHGIIVRVGIVDVHRASSHLLLLFLRDEKVRVSFFLPNFPAFPFLFLISLSLSSFFFLTLLLSLFSTHEQQIVVQTTTDPSRRRRFGRHRCGAGVVDAETGSVQRRFHQGTQHAFVCFFIFFFFSFDSIARSAFFFVFWR